MCFFAVANERQRGEERQRIRKQSIREEKKVRKKRVGDEWCEKGRADDEGEQESMKKDKITGEHG